jgi:hypothetical protein
MNLIQIRIWDIFRMEDKHLTKCLTRDSIPNLTMKLREIPKQEIIINDSRHRKSMTLATSKFRAGDKLLVNWLDREIC